jgi:hypothetical protein
VASVTSITPVPRDHPSGQREASLRRAIFGAARLPSIAAILICLHLTATALAAPLYPRQGTATSLTVADRPSDPDTVMRARPANLRVTVVVALASAAQPQRHHQEPKPPDPKRYLTRASISLKCATAGWRQLAHDQVV